MTPNILPVSNCSTESFPPQGRNPLSACTTSFYNFNIICSYHPLICMHRFMFSLDIGTSLTYLLPNYLSINQLGAYHSLLTTSRMITSGKPEYFAKKFTRRYPNSDSIFPARQMNSVNVCSYKLSISRSGFLYRAGKLWNHLPESLRTQRKISSFKTELRKWIKELIPMKPHYC